MRVLIVGHFFFPLGAASAARMRNLATGLCNNGAEVHLIVTAPMPYKNEYLLSLLSGEKFSCDWVGECHVPLAASSSRWHKVQHKLGWFRKAYLSSSYAASRKVRAQLAASRYDFIFVYDRSAWRILPILLLSRKYKVPCILDVVESNEQFSGMGGRLSPIYWDSVIGGNIFPRFFDGLTVITHGLRAKYAKLSCKNILVLPSIENWSPAANKIAVRNEGVFRLVWISALIPRDNPELLLEAMSLLQEQGVSVVLDILGRFHNNGHGQRIAQWCQQDPVLQQCVNLVGEVSDSELASRMGQADGLVLSRRDAPAEQYAFPTRLVEYLKQKRPIFVSDVGDIGMYLKNGRDAILLSPHNPTAIAQAIATIVQSPGRGQAIGQQGYAQGAKCFDRDKHAAKLLAFAQSLQNSDDVTEYVVAKKPTLD